MRVFLLTSSLVLAALASPDYSDSWEEFKEKYEKQYDTEEEETHRSQVWRSNVEMIKEHNSLAETGEFSFQLGENVLADLSTHEINNYYNGLSVEELSHHGEVFQTREDQADLPKAVDWRINGTVTPVKDQKRCGSCWAFSTTGSLEGQHAIKTKSLVSLSEQNLVDCSFREGNLGCWGGLMDRAFKYVKINGGIDTESSYPYTATMGKCHYNATNSGANLTSWVDVKTGSENDLQTAVAKVGPISVGIDASQSSFHFYKAGVYSDPKCSSTKLDHGVLAVGYGTAATDGTEDFWLVKNSWGETWGMKGYINMARNKNNACGIATRASYPVL